VTHALFRTEDDAILSLRDEDGNAAEPYTFLPVLPMVLVNGSSGIGTGFSTSVPSYNPLDLIANIERALANKSLAPMLPWWRGFTGVVEPVSHNPEMPRPTGKEKKATLAMRESVNFRTRGLIQKLSKTTVRITELPVGVWTRPYKAWLGKHVGNSSGAKKELSIKTFTEHHDVDSVDFCVTLSPGVMTGLKDSELLELFHLSDNVSLDNMHLFDLSGKLRKFASPLEILAAFIPARLEYYGKRKALRVSSLCAHLAGLRQKLKFVHGIVAGRITLLGKSREELFQQLRALGFSAQLPEALPLNDPRGSGTVFPLKPLDASSSGNFDSGPESGKESGSEAFDALLQLPVGTFTQESVARLQKQVATVEKELADLKASSPQALWLADLQEARRAILAHWASS
jgi:DNA topoisomerase-2